MKNELRHGNSAAQGVDWQIQNGPEPVRQHHVVPGLTTIKEWLVPYVSPVFSPAAFGRQI